MTEPKVSSKILATLRTLEQTVHQAARLGEVGWKYDPKCFNKERAALLAVIEEEINRAANPEWLSQALNSGDGSYKP